jgi:hypothetical protein
MIVCADTDCEGTPYYTDATMGFQVNFYPCWTNGSCWCSCLPGYSWAEPISFLWDFGDGTTSTEKFPIHTYDPDCPDDGTDLHYTVTLTIVFSNGAVATDTASVVVECGDSDPALIQLLYPTGGETLSGTETVRWFAIDDILGNDLPIYLYYSGNDGETWAYVAGPLYNNDEEGHGEYSWNTNSYSDGSYMLKAEAVKELYVTADTSDPFTINNGIVGAMVSSILITDTTIESSLYVKDGDSIQITAGITGASDIVEVYADLSQLGGGVNTIADGFDGYTASWTLEDVACHPSDGTITVEVKLDNENSKTATITADNTDPETVFIKPVDGLYFFNSKLLPLGRTIIIGGITVEVEGIDNSGVAYAEFYLDGELQTTISEEYLEWYMNFKLRGTHTIEVIIYDYAGNSASISKDMKVFNFFGN